MLLVVAESYNEQTPLDRTETRLLDGGVTVGRDASNTLVLSDPTQTVSRRHLRFARAPNGDYEVTNISAANHVQVNDHNLVSGARRVVGDQDQIHIGGFVLRIREIDDHGGHGAAITEPLAEPPSAPQAVRTSARAADDRELPDVATVPAAQAGCASQLIADDFLGDRLGGMSTPRSVTHSRAQAPDADPGQVLDSSCSGARCDDPILAMNARGIDLMTLSGKCDELVSGPPGERTAEALLADPLMETHRKARPESCVDPLEMFGDAGESVFAGLGLPGDPSPAGMDTSHYINHRVELNTPFAIPVARAVAEDPAQQQCAPAVRPLPQAIIPDDDFALPSGEGGRRPQPVLEPGCDVPIAQNRAPRAENAVLPVPDEGLPARLQCGEAAAHPMHPDSTPASAAHPRVPVTPPPVPLPTGDNASAQADLYHALLDGLGLSCLPGRDQLDPEFMRLLGRLLRAATQGTVDLISARATVKREVRANVTVIAPERNNPLKFSPDSEVGLMFLLGRPYPGFMEPVEAMCEAYADLYAHQMGIVSGMRSALGHVLERFNPETIVTSAQRSGLIEGMLAVGRKARLWDAYGRYFQNTREQAEDRFQDFFGAVFLDAYDEVAGPRARRAGRGKAGGE